MDFFEIIWEYVLHLDTSLHSLVSSAPILSYVALFFVVFAETGFVVTTFLPSDAVIFAACSLTAVQGSFSLPILFVLFFVAATLGDSLNFSIGRALRKRIKKKGKILFIKAESIEKTNKIFNRSGGAAILISRFIPLLRGLMPFVTGISREPYRWFFPRNLIGIAVWCTLYCSLGTFFGNIDFVKNHFALVVFGITGLTLLTAAVSFLLKKLILEKKKRKEK